MALYESIFIARPDVASSDVKAITDKFTSVVKDGGGNVVDSEYWGLRNLAYRVKKNKKGHYTMLKVDAPAKAIQELDRQQRLHDDVIRSVNIRVDAFSKEPSPLLKAAND